MFVYFKEIQVDIRVDPLVCFHNLSKFNVNEIIERIQMPD